jgi:hypothetical protein
MTSPTLVLNKVERLPSLVQDLADNVDIALEAALPTLPPLSSAFPTAERRRTNRRILPMEARNEKQLPASTKKPHQLL